MLERERERAHARETESARERETNVYIVLACVCVSICNSSEVDLRRHISCENCLEKVNGGFDPTTNQVKKNK